MIFGGSAPLLMTWLIGMTGIASIPSYMVIATAALTLVSTLYLKETAGQPLREA